MWSLSCAMTFCALTFILAGPGQAVLLSEGGWTEGSSEAMPLLTVLWQSWQTGPFDSNLWSPRSAHCLNIFYCCLCGRDESNLMILFSRDIWCFPGPLPWAPRTQVPGQMEKHGTCEPEASCWRAHCSASLYDSLWSLLRYSDQTSLTQNPAP